MVKWCYQGQGRIITLNSGPDSIRHAQPVDMGHMHPGIAMGMAWDICRPHHHI